MDVAGGRCLVLCAFIRLRKLIMNIQVDKFFCFVLHCLTYSYSHNVPTRGQILLRTALSWL